MAALCAGSYGLSQQQQQNPGNDNKELIFVKLTDSALRAIEEFQRNQLKLGTALNPSIQFLANGQGYLSFPSSSSNVQKFSFSITDNESGSSIECIQQNQGQQLQNMGHIPHKMRIHANDDVYETTRHRMAAAEENQKNKCTREIKPNQNDIGRKVKLKNPTARVNNIPSNNSVLSKRDLLHSSSNNYSNSNSAVNSSNLSSSVPALANNNHHNQLLSTNNNISNYGNFSSKLSKSNGLQQHNNHHISNNQSAAVATAAAAAAAAAAALQQQQQPQPLQPKLGYQHTVHDPPHQQQQQSQQKSENGIVPSRVANGRTQHKSSNPEIMKRNIRRKPQNLTPPLSSDGGSSTSGQSPSSAHNGSSPPSGSKRPSLAGTDEVGSMPTSKKPRISHYKKDVHPEISRSNVTPNAQESEDSGVSLSYSLVSNDVARRIQHPTNDVTDVMAERDNYDDQITAYRETSKKVKSLKDDFSDQFTRITSVEQRRKYKTEFDNDFQEYRRLHEIVERVSRKFAQLEEDLQHERHNERRYKEIQRQIIKEYDESIKDIRFQETKQRFNYLHNKLSHIKHLVHDYDVTITNGLCRPQENY